MSASTGRDLKMRASAAEVPIGASADEVPTGISEAEVPGDPGAQEESHAHGEKDQEDQRTGAEAVAEAGQRQVGGVMW